MKKSNLFLFLGIFFFVSVASVWSQSNVPFSEELIIAPDPENPLQGTWIFSLLGSTYVHVINGMHGEWWVYKSSKKGWEKQASYTIIPNNDIFVTNTNWKINLTKDKDGDLLIVEKNKYRRFKSILE